MQPPPTPKPYVHAQVPPSSTPVGRSALGLGIAALVIGILTATFIWAPYAGLCGIPVAVIGLGLGVAGVIVSLASGRRQPLRMPLIGVAACALSIIVGWVAIRSRVLSPEEIAQQDAAFRVKQAQFEAQLAREAAEREAYRKAFPDHDWKPRPEGLPPFKVVKDDYQLKDGWKNDPAYRRVSIEAWGDLTETNLGEILDYAAAQRSFPTPSIDIVAINRSSGAQAQQYYVAARDYVAGQQGTREGRNRVNVDKLLEYRKATGAAAPATRPAPTSGKKE